MSAVLSVRDLGVTIGRSTIVDGVSFDVQRGQTLGIVGESGSGKSMTVLAATGLIDAPGAVVTGASRLGSTDAAGLDLVAATPTQLRRVHGDRIGFIFQDPSTSLNPLLTLERQLTEGPEAHLGLTRRQARSRALALLDSVGIPNPSDRLAAYPHQLSGGQRQRVMIAVALACDPDLLIADEPTTALDVTTQAQIIDLVRGLQEERGMAVVWISHDLGVIGQVADDVTVLYRGEAVEQRPIVEVFDEPRHDYTRTLLDARPVLGLATPAPADPNADVLLSIRDLDVSFPITTATGKSTVHAVRGASLDIRRGHTLGLVGESGSGKSTVAGVLTGLTEPASGTVTLEGRDIFGRRGTELTQLRREISMVFQDPFSSLNPRMSVAEAIAEPLRVHRLAAGAKGRRGRVEELLELVRLPREFADRFPHELSGGQRQRVSIARALAVEPKLMILDESTASLDVSIQSQVLELLATLQQDLGLTYLFIAHDLAIVQQMSHEIAVMRQGEIVELSSNERLYADPQHDYTRTLLAAIPPERPRAAASEA
ncbi:MAG: ABC transporter ATP-binding protein [Salinibacterium sp.]|nr:ABC transporter ATP-binding protein [Salinibacterium sp.]MBF0673388.1 ABC transporter ATP-binding protein [Salinibacterium sp.]